jgi:hypothetical protein
MAVPWTQLEKPAMLLREARRGDEGRQQRAATGFVQTRHLAQQKDEQGLDAIVARRY